MAAAFTSTSPQEIPETRAALSTVETLLGGGHSPIAQIFEKAPFPVEIYDAEGTTVWINDAMLKMNGYDDPGDRGKLVGKYNVFRDSAALVAVWITEAEARVRSGEIVTFTNQAISKEEYLALFALKDTDISSVCLDTTITPVMDETGTLRFFMVTMNVRWIYYGKEEIARAKTYIETHWLKPFDAAHAAHAAHLSKTHFYRLFKKHTGMTPREYYAKYKIGKLTEYLQNPALSIGEAFAACQMEYNSNSLKMFKDVVGTSPTKYRERALSES
ncbi:hypothetical protein AGMMS49983_03410 [Clostridia bacterium]|nr:hypothetical protein AGMMS49983_03410 [Clostridia bacterium]